MTQLERIFQKFEMEKQTKLFIKARTSRLVFLCLQVFVLSSCVSLNIGPKDPKMAKGINYTPPREPFFEITSPSSDHTWQSQKNGSSISYKSTCNEQSDPSLENMETATLSGLQDLNVISRDYIAFNEREALKFIVKAKVDGIPIKIHSLLFKKNSCSYNLSYVAVEKAYEESLGEFNSFVGSFHAP